ncbi:MAG: type II secretion system protein [Halanaerobiales bacterium]|nr:type II secretion system protein [Halanaerobiales bacterium]
MKFLLIKVLKITEQSYENAFTLLEVLIVITFMSILCIGVLDLFLENIQFVYLLDQRSENLFQLRAGLESMVKELQEADPHSIVLLEENSEPLVFSQIQFLKYESLDLYWFYVNSSNSMIRAVKRPNKNWGRTTIAIGIEKIALIEIDSKKTLQITLEGGKNEAVLELKTIISPGFE